jgi:hypothetical protein
MQEEVEVVVQGEVVQGEVSGCVICGEDGVQWSVIGSRVIWTCDHDARWLRALGE